MFSNIYKGRRVLVTGHTGFKGSWLATWLLHLGADVTGYAIDVPSTPSGFEILRLDQRMHHQVGDIRDRNRLKQVVASFQPEIIFHLAAQPLVRRSYNDPVTTFETNTIGTLNILESIRHHPCVRAAVMITSDKCYKNVEWEWGYRENDMLGGEDPYSASKSCAELLAFSYLKSFFKIDAGLAAVATARAGNVIGGGDWAEDRIVPDCIRSWSKNETVRVRNPKATRPWQHVLEPLSGYLHLGAELWRRNPDVIGEPYNFGPDATVNHPVKVLIETLGTHWPGSQWAFDEPQSLARREAKFLKLCCDKALADLRWQPVLAFADTVRITGEWYRQYYSAANTDLFALTMQQIELYCAMARQKGLTWVQ